MKRKTFSNLKMLVFFNTIILAMTVIKGDLMSGRDLGQYLLVFNLVNFIANILGEAVHLYSVKIMNKLDLEEGVEAKNEYTNLYMNLIIVISLITMLIMLVLGLAFLPDTYNKGLYLIALPQIILVNIRSIYIAFIQSHHGYRTGAEGNLLSILIYVIYLRFGHLSPIGLMIASHFAVLGQIASLQRGMDDRGFKFKLDLNFKDKSLIRHCKIMVLSLIVLIIIFLDGELVSFFIDRGMIVRAARPQVVAKEISDILKTVFIMPIIIVSFPYFAWATIEEKERLYKIFINFQLLILAFIGIGLGLGFILDGDLLRLLYLLGPVYLLYYIRVYYSMEKIVRPIGIFIIYLIVKIGLMKILASKILIEPYIYAQLASLALIILLVNLDIRRRIKEEF